MFIHLVMLEFKATADADFFAEVDRFAQRVRDECADVCLFEFGANEADRSQGYTHAVVSGFKDSNAHDVYQASAVHVAMKAFLLPYVERMVVFDGAAPLLNG